MSLQDVANELLKIQKKFAVRERGQLGDAIIETLRGHQLSIAKIRARLPDYNPIAVSSGVRNMFDRGDTIGRCGEKLKFKYFVREEA